MDFELSEEQAELRRSVRQVLARESPIERVREVVENGSSPEEPWKSAIELGWAAINVPAAVPEPGTLGLCLARVDKGFDAPDLGLVLVSDQELFHRQKVAKPRIYRHRYKGLKGARSIESFAELKEGDVLGRRVVAIQEAQDFGRVADYALHNSGAHAQLRHRATREISA